MDLDVPQFFPLNIFKELELKTVGPAIVVNGNNITSNNLSDIENNFREMLDLI